MPGFNRKGPDGEGPMSGRGKGRCNPSGRGRGDLETRERTGADAPNQSRYRKKNIHRMEGSESNAPFQLGNGRGFRPGKGLRKRDGSCKGLFA